MKNLRETCLFYLNSDHVYHVSRCHASNRCVAGCKWRAASCELEIFSDSAQPPPHRCEIQAADGVVGVEITRWRVVSHCLTRKAPWKPVVAIVPNAIQTLNSPEYEAWTPTQQASNHRDRPLSAHKYKFFPPSHFSLFSSSFLPQSNTTCSSHTPTIFAATAAVTPRASR